MPHDDKPDFSRGVCPIPLAEYPTVQLAHGGGGRMSQMLIERMLVPAFSNPALERLHDGAVLDVGGVRLAFSTDSYVVRPLFFPGGNIGTLAVHGTLNDVAMCGATPIALSVGLVLEEGLPMSDLWRIVSAMRDAAAGAGVHIVTGDTKVVDRGKGDGLYVNTSGIGLVPPGREVGPERARPGDKILVSGTLADHGIAIMSVREGLRFDTTIESDTACLVPLVETLFERIGPSLHVLRDPTRGGVASSLNEIAAAARVGVLLSERDLPVREQVHAACELLGFDPLYVANEGKCIAIVAPQAADAALEAWRAHPLGSDAAIIGEVTDGPPGIVQIRSRIGATRIVDMLTGEQLPRIC